MKQDTAKKCRKGRIMQTLYVTPTWACFLKSSIFVVQKATVPKNGTVAFWIRQNSIGPIRSSLAMSYDAWRRHQFLTNQKPRNDLTQTHWHRINILSGTALRAAPAKMPTFMHTYIQAHIYTDKKATIMRNHIKANIQTKMHVYIRTQCHTYASKYIQIYEQAWYAHTYFASAHTDAHTHTNKYVNTHTCTCKQKCVWTSKHTSMYAAAIGTHKETCLHPINEIHQRIWQEIQERLVWIFQLKKGKTGDFLLYPLINGIV